MKFVPKIIFTIQIIHFYTGSKDEKLKELDQKLCAALLESDSEPLEEVKSFLNAGASSDFVDKNGNSAVHICCKKGYINILTLIIKLYPEEVDRSNIKDESLLVKSLEHENFDCWKKLIENGASNAIEAYLKSKIRHEKYLR